MFASIPVASSSTSSVVVSSVRHGYQYTFDQAYSQRLSGVISPSEYVTSIQRINLASQTLLGWFTGFIGFGTTMAGLCLIVYGEVHFGVYGFPSSFYIGMGMFLAGGLFYALSRHFVYKMLIRRMTDAIAYENTQYSSRQCAWRLHSTPAVTRIRGYVTTVYDFSIEIEIPVLMNVSVRPYVAQAMPPLYQPEYEPPVYMPAPAQSPYAPPPLPPPPTSSSSSSSSSSHLNEPLLPQHDGISSALSLCPGCQRKLTLEDKFCSQCGFRVNVI